MRSGCSAAIALALLAAVGCERESSCQAPAISAAGQALFGGEPEPGVLELSAAQRRSFGTLHGVGAAPNDRRCSAVTITPGLVLSAAHCQAYGPLEFIGSEADGGGRTPIPVAELVIHPDRDVLLARLVADDDAALEPIARFDETPDAGWVGVVAQLAGTGLTEQGLVGDLEFLAEAIVEVREHELIVDGVGRSGACTGDSGGPLLVRGLDGRARVAGVLSRGARSCRGIDVYERTDTLSEWFAEQGVPAPEPPAAGSCGDVDAAGLCRAGTSLSCERGELRAERCSGGRRCGWSERATGYRCVEPHADPCRGVDALGSCDGTKLRRCDRGALIEFDCASCGLGCARELRAGAALCVPARASSRPPAAGAPHSG